MARITRLGSGTMAGKGGGSWKVAYADFVTAMMAFFLVMWIGAQDQKTRQSVANYFIDPFGVSKKPLTTGATFDSPPTGPVTGESKTSASSGTNTVGGPEPSPSTKVVIDWYQSDPKHHAYWKERAQRIRAEAHATKGLKDPDRTAESRLRLELEDAMLKGASKQGGNGAVLDLAHAALREVNWTQATGELFHAHTGAD